MNGPAGSSVRRVSRPLLRLLIGVLVVLLGVTACTNTPPPPLVNKKNQKAPPKPVNLGLVTVDVSSVQGGYNPHLLADRSTITSALSTLLLPSMFRPAADGTPRLDTSVLNSAEVTSAQPFTVTYSLRTDASWSDGVPIAAEDFVYLRDQMASQPGVVDPAGYRLISDVNSEQNGKVVQVVFDKPYPGWRSLFNNLVPAHLLKDAPGGWNAGMQENFPAVASPFSIKAADQARGVIALQRNERYWGTPSVLDELDLRKADSGGAADALRAGDSQLAALPIGGSSGDLFNDMKNAGLRNTTQREVYRPEVVQLLLRRETETMSDSRVRKAVADAIDRDAVIGGTVGDSEIPRLRTDSMVLARSHRGYRPTMPPDAPGARRDLAVTDRLLTSAGYQRDPDGWSKDGEPLKIQLAAPAGRTPYKAVAEKVAGQLREAGIETTIRLTNPDVLFGEQTGRSTPAVPANPAARPGDDGEVDMVVAPRPVDDDPTATLAENYGCPQQLPNSTATAQPNTAGFCDPDLQSTIDSALTGEMPLSEALSTVEPQLWRQAVAIPLFQLADRVAVSPVMSKVDNAPELFAPYASASVWKRKRP